MSRYLDGPAPRILAHRGWHTGDLTGLENTMAAFVRAADEGIRYVETDVHATRDGVLVAFHDTILDRVTDRTGPIGEQTWDQVRRARIGGREPIPLLAEVLSELPGTRFNIDAKSAAAVGPLIDVLRETGSADRVCLASFSGKRLAALRRALGPDVASSLGPSEVTGLVAGRPRRATVSRAVAAQVPLRQGRIPVVTPGFVRRTHAIGLEVHAWTINEPATMRRLLDIGVDGIVTDRPDLLRDILAERGHQPS